MSKIKRAVFTALIKLHFFSDLPWNQTIMPTLLGHTTQESAGQDVMSKFSSIIEASQTNLPIHF